MNTKQQTGNWWHIWEWFVNEHVVIVFTWQALAVMSEGVSGENAGRSAAPTWEQNQHNYKCTESKSTEETLYQHTNNISRWWNETFHVNSCEWVSISRLTLAWYCSSMTWPGNSGSGTAANFLMMTSRACRPAIRSWLLWSVAAMKAMRIKSQRCSTR